MICSHVNLKIIQHAFFKVNSFMKIMSINILIIFISLDYQNGPMSLFTFYSVGLFSLIMFYKIVWVGYDIYKLVLGESCRYFKMIFFLVSSYFYVWSINSL